MIAATLLTLKSCAPSKISKIVQPTVRFNAIDCCFLSVCCSGMPTALHKPSQLCAMNRFSSSSFPVVAIVELLLTSLLLMRSMRPAGPGMQWRFLALMRRAVSEGLK
jgi:hypothetical protein